MLYTSILAAARVDETPAWTRPCLVIGNVFQDLQLPSSAHSPVHPPDGQYRTLRVHTLALLLLLPLTRLAHASRKPHMHTTVPRSELTCPFRGKDPSRTIQLQATSYTQARRLSSQTWSGHSWLHPHASSASGSRPASPSALVLQQQLTSSRSLGLLAWTSMEKERMTFLTSDVWTETCAVRTSVIARPAKEGKVVNAARAGGDCLRCKIRGIPAAP